MRHRHDPGWYRLDNAGKIYPAVISGRVTTFFRLSATLTETVNVGNLNQALRAMTYRCPYYRVHLRPGFFWFYFETQKKVPNVEPDSQYPCMRPSFKRKGVFPFRVRAYDNRISVEFSHAITDGTGALLFLQGLLGEYFRLQGHEIPEESLPLNPRVDPDEEEFEDGFKRYFDPKLPSRTAKNLPAFHLPEPLMSRGRYRVITGTVKTEQLLSAAKAAGVSLTEWLAAVYCDTFQTEYESLTDKQKKRHGNPIQIMIPINLRRFFPSRTMRNFFITAGLEIDPRTGHYPFEEILDRMHHGLRTMVNPRILAQQIARNVRGEMNPVVRLFPLQIKKPIMHFLYRSYGQNTHTSLMTNLGLVKLPPEMKGLVSHLDFIPPPSRTNKIGAGIISHGDETRISFGSLASSSDIERLFFRKLTERGISVSIETNDQRRKNL